jgi:hypothetical protein
MTIAAGSTILASDLNAINSSGLTSLRADLATEPRWHVLNLLFKNVASATAIAWKTRDIVIPDDLYIAEVAIQSSDHVGAVVVTLDNGAMVQPISISATLATGISKGDRWYSTATNVQQILYKGSILNCTITTTNTTTPSLLNVSLILKSTLKDV